MEYLFPYQTTPNELKHQYHTQKSNSIVQHIEASCGDSAYFPQSFAQAVAITNVCNPILEQTDISKQKQCLPSKKFEQNRIENKSRDKYCISDTGTCTSNSLGKLKPWGDF